MNWTATAAGILVLLAFLYSWISKDIPSRVHQAPRSEFGLVPVGGFGSQLDADGLE